MPDSTLCQIAELPSMSHDELKELWRALYGKEPPAYNRTFLVKRLAYRIQEIAYGGLSERARIRMKELVASDGKDIGMRRRGARMERGRDDSLPIAGTRIVREWNDGLYEVTVTDSGFEYDGRLYRSLSAIAKAITGTHWNGKLFFGVAKPKVTKRSR